ncbi:hypothetical protein U1Q18_009385 [Sarracenia purpurea var. burkii]
MPLAAAAISTALLIPRRGCTYPPPRSKINTFFSPVCTEIYRVPVSHRVTVLKLTPSDVGIPLLSPKLMARSSVVMFMAFVVFASFLPSSLGRKLLTGEDNKKGSELPSLESLYLSNSLPKGKVTPSSPSMKGHAMIVDEKLIARHLAAVDRILRSVPSPGVGH